MISRWPSVPGLHTDQWHQLILKLLFSLHNMIGSSECEVPLLANTFKRSHIDYNKIKTKKWVNELLSDGIFGAKRELTEDRKMKNDDQYGNGVYVLMIRRNLLINTYLKNVGQCDDCRPMSWDG